MPSKPLDNDSKVIEWIKSLNDNFLSGKKVKLKTITLMCTEPVYYNKDNNRYIIDSPAKDGYAYLIEKLIKKADDVDLDEFYFHADVTHNKHHVIPLKIDKGQEKSSCFIVEYDYSNEKNHFYIKKRVIDEYLNVLDYDDDKKEQLKIRFEKDYHKVLHCMVVDSVKTKTDVEKILDSQEVLTPIEESFESYNIMMAVRKSAGFDRIFHKEDSKQKFQLCLFCAFELQEGYEKEKIINFITSDKGLLELIAAIIYENILTITIVEDINNRFKAKAIRNAISAVMSRNLSHNTGSHKAPWIKNFYAERFQRIYDFFMTWEADKLPNDLKELFSTHNDKKLDIEQKKTKIGEIFRKQVQTKQHQFTGYFDFLNDNMEFIADITTSSASQRIGFEYNFQEVFLEYDRLKFMHHGLFDDNKFKDDDISNGFFKIKLDRPSQKNKDFGNALVNIPNGQLGKMAFYVIIENILRNFYKHSSFENNKINFKISLNSHDNDYWVIDFYDLHGGESKNKAERTDDTLRKLNNYINLSILKEEVLTLRDEGWGFIEMKACAAYLVNFPLEEINNNTLNEAGFIITEQGSFLPLITANFYDEHGKIEEKSNVKNLGYRFFIKKVKKFLIDIDLFEDLDTLDCNTLKSNGVFIENLSNFNQIFDDFDFVITKGKKPKRIDKNQRLLLWDSDKISSEEIINVNGFAELVWTKYISQQHYKKDIGDFFITNKVDDYTNFKTNIIKNTSIIAIDYHGKDLPIKDRDFDTLKEFLWYIPEDNINKTELNTFFRYADNKLIQLQIYELLNTKISIFDERIQAETSIDYNNNPKITIRDIHSFGNIFIPKIGELDLTNSEFVENNLEEKIIEHLKTDNYVILHFTLFEKLATKNNVEDIEKYYKTFEKYKGILVLCSGRGRPSNLFNNCYYIHLSTIQHAIIRIRSKYAIVKLLKSLREI